ncbi:hypothetical protein Q7P37_003847 [Cladosporium fusiforme]
MRSSTKEKRFLPRRKPLAHGSYRQGRRASCDNSNCWLAIPLTTSQAPSLRSAHSTHTTTATMQTTRAFNMLRQRAAPAFRAQPVRNLRLQASPKMRSPVPKEEHSAHTISQRIRSLRKIPVELLPIGAVLIVALGAAAYSIGRKFYTDSTLRLSRSGPRADH